jgi:hypothetical protein
MQPLLDEISRHHFPNPPATPEQIEAFEQRVGWRLDPDLRAFYLHCNGAELFEKPDSPYRFVSLSGLIRARVAMRGEDSDTWGAASWYVLGNLHDGDRVLVDVGEQVHGRYPLRDGWHEGFPDPELCPRIAASFSEFLEKALRSGGNKFWLKSS